MTRPHFFLIPVIPFHHPDESPHAMSLTFILESLYRSVGTALIVEIWRSTATSQARQNISASTLTVL